jgi:RNA polymerase sigma factor (TIGR02999 family)
MRARSPRAIKQLLVAWQAGDRRALDALVPVVYEELRRLAHRLMKRERAGHVLQTTALVNEAYLNLVGARELKWRDRAHFFAIGAKLMRDDPRALRARPRRSEARRRLPAHLA